MLLPCRTYEVRSFGFLNTNTLSLPRSVIGESKLASPSPEAKPSFAHSALHGCLSFASISDWFNALFTVIGRAK